MKSSNLRVVFISLLLSLYTGFGIFILFTSLIRFKNISRNELLTRLMDSACLIVAVASVAFLAISIAGVYEAFQNEEDYYTLRTRMTGPYWFGYCIFPISYGIIPLLFWIPKIRRSKLVRVIVAILLLFVLHLEKIIIMVTSLHRDYVPGSWAMLPGLSLLYDWIVSVILFAIVLACSHALRLKGGLGNHSWFPIELRI